MKWFVRLGYVFLVVCGYFMAISGCATTSGTNGERGGAQLITVGENICQEIGTGRMWQNSREGLVLSAEAAQQSTMALNLGGYTDWRLPTRDELFDLYYIFFWKKNGGCSMNNSGNYWIVDDEGTPLPGHWETYFLCAPEHRFIRSLSTKGYVRAVRP